MFKRLKGDVIPLPSPQRIKNRNDRWETGLDEEVREVRDENKERMLHLLIQKIENKKSKPSARFHFEEGMSYEEKYRLVSEWWNDFRFHFLPFLITCHYSMLRDMDITMKRSGAIFFTRHDW
mgnify:FL=1